jgi:SNF2 family DNA or RNA helicase
MELELDQLQGTKIFVVRGGPPGLARAYGAMFDRQRGRWFFPAYPPFGLLVVADLKRFVPQLAHGKGVSEWIGYLESVPERLRKRETPAIEYATKPFDHQVEGTSLLYHYPRAALFWDAGTGKSKVIVDLLLLLGRPRTIIVTPRVTLFNWIQEIEVHSGGRIRASALAKGPSQKRRAIRESNNMEVLVLSYGTARTMAIPKVQASAMRRLKEAIGKGLLSASMAMQLGRTIRRLSDPEEQEAFIAAKLEGAPLSEIEAGVDRAVAGSGPQWLLDLQYDVLVADESHAMSDQGASQTKAMLALSRKAARRYIMSGTPTEGNPLQLYSQMKFLAPCIVPEDWIRYSDLFLVRAKHNLLDVNYISPLTTTTLPHRLSFPATHSG